MRRLMPGPTLLDMQSAKLKRRLLRISLILLAGWFLGVVAVLNDDFCATTHWKSEKQIRQAEDEWRQSHPASPLATSKIEPGAGYGLATPRDRQGTDIAVSTSSVDCLQWSPLNSKLVARTGGIAVNWRVRREAFVVLLGYPLALALALAAGAALTWIIEGFRHKA